MGTDKNADVLWVGNSWGASLARINTKTSESDDRPAAGSDDAGVSHRRRQQAQRVGQSVDLGPDLQVDPATQKVTMFDLPVRGTEIRHISLLERDGKLNVVMPVYRSSQMGVMTVRSEAELAASRRRRSSYSGSQRFTRLFSCSVGRTWSVRPSSSEPPAALSRIIHIDGDVANRLLRTEDIVPDRYPLVRRLRRHNHDSPLLELMKGRGAHGFAVHDGRPGLAGQECGLAVHQDEDVAVIGMDFRFVVFELPLRIKDNARVDQ